MASAVLEQIARARALLAFDFDGTLAPIVDDRTQAQLRCETRALLRTARGDVPGGDREERLAVHTGDLMLVDCDVGGHGCVDVNLGTIGFVLTKCVFGKLR